MLNKNKPTAYSALHDSPRTIDLPTTLDRAWVERSFLVTEKTPRPTVLDFSKTRHIDSAGMSLLYLLNRRYAKAGSAFTLRNVPDAILSSLKTWQPASAGKKTALKSGRGFFQRVGDRTLSFADMASHALSMLTEILFWGSFGLIKRRDFRRGVLAEQMFLMGYQSLGIICLLAFLVGVVLALQAAIQLNRYGAGIFLAPMIAITEIKELGPLLTAIIISGRNGSATTAEIATMMVGEEIDALKTMGINPIQFVVVPKFWAMTATMPILTLFATIVGVAGGFAVAIVYLGIASPLFMGELLKSVVVIDVVENLVKSIVFSWLIVWVGAFHGFKVKGGAEEVGRETTSSVVTGIFIIIVADAVFSFIF
jgi:phospholipid/cholesterol/gamma-HCH transport system permease protein